ncbi:MAG: class I SAM-dependent methyltransferase [Rhodocyclaceae bacterium]|nr:class I SAM-dependent methyltransferase [Rhodocyclaceae bacterium]
MTRHLDLGCGDTPRNPYQQQEVHAIDLSLPEGFDSAHFRVANLSCQPIPYPDDSFDSVSAYDFLEHVPRVLSTADGTSTVFPFVRLMNEVWRVLVPGGRFYALTPGVPCLEAFTDPTHVNFITEHTHTYFCGEVPPGRMYGFTGRFEARRAERAMLPEDFSPSTPLSWYRTMKRARHLRRGNLSHLVWELVAVKTAAPGRG